MTRRSTRARTARATRIRAAHRGHVTGGALIALCCFGHDVHAQVATVPDSSTRQERNVITTVVLREPSLLAPIRAPAPVIRFAATQADKTVAAQFGAYTRAAEHTDAAVALTLSGPVGTSGKPALLADLDGLRTATSASVNVTFVRWNPHFTADASGHLRVRGICAAYAATLPPAERRDFTCAESQIRDPAYLARYRAAVSYGTPWFGTLRATVGQKTFDYVDPTTLADATARRTAQQGDVGIGRMLPTGGLIDLVYRYERSYAGGTDEQVCRPIGTTRGLGCANATLGGPTVTQRSVLALELRQYAASTLGLAPTVRYDMRQRVTAFELPIYFLQNQAGGLASGIRAGYRSDTRRVTLVAFVAEFAAPFTR